jgi:hypothetical protein
MAQGGQMARYRGLRQVKYGHEVADAMFPVCEQGNNPQADWFGQGLEKVCCCLHKIYVFA